MNVSIWDPFREMEALLNQYTGTSTKRLPSGDVRNAENNGWAPVVDIIETDNEFLLKVELPGVEKNDVSISIDNRVLTVRGEKHNNDKENKFHRSECRYGSFVRNFTLPQEVDVDGVEAVCKNGVLTLTLKKMEQAKPKQIEVKVN
jgi:HSP20 family protein